MYENNIYKSRWICKVKNILDLAGLSNIWLCQFDYNVNRTWLSQKIKQCYSDMYIQEWNNSLETSPKSVIYRLFKIEHRYEPYLDILSLNYRITFTRFRLSNHRLSIETGRWRNIPRDERKCDICNEGYIGDEFHFLFECNVLNDLRTQYLYNYYYRNPSTSKLKILFNKENKELLIKLCKYIQQGMKRI